EMNNRTGSDIKRSMFATPRISSRSRLCSTRIPLCNSSKVILYTCDLIGDHANHGNEASFTATVILFSLEKLGFLGPAPDRFGTAGVFVAPWGQTNSSLPLRRRQELAGNDGGAHNPLDYTRTPAEGKGLYTALPRP